MKVTVNAKDLTKALKDLSLVFKTKTGFEILSCVQIKALDNTLTLTANNLSLIMQEKIEDCDIVEEGVILVNASDLLKSISTLDTCDITLETDKKNNSFKVISGEYKLNLKTYDENEFPPVENTFDNVDWVELDNIEEFKESLSKVLISVDTSPDFRTPFDGVLFSPDSSSNKITLCSTDGHRLSLSKLSTKIDKKMCDVVIPHKCLMQIQNCLNDKVFISVTSNKVYFTDNKVFIESTKINESFPNFEKVFIKENIYKTILAINKEELKTCIRGVNAFSTSSIILDYNKDILSISTQNSITGAECLDKIETRVIKGSEFRVGVNGKFLLDVLNVIKGDNVLIYILDPDSPIQVNEEGGDDTKFIIMPMQV